MVLSKWDVTQSIDFEVPRLRGDLISVLKGRMTQKCSWADDVALEIVDWANKPMMSEIADNLIYKGQKVGGVHGSVLMGLGRRILALAKMTDDDVAEMSRDRWECVHGE